MEDAPERLSTSRAPGCALLLAVVTMLWGCAGPQIQAEIPGVEEQTLADEMAQRFTQAESKLFSPDRETQLRGAVALLSMGDAVALEAVLDAMKGSDDPGVRASMMEAAAFCEDHRCFDALLAGLEDEASSVREAAADALSRFNRPDEVQAVVAYLQAPERSPTVRQMLYRALGKGLALQAVPALIQALSSENEQSRSAALEALRHIARRSLPPEPQQWERWWSAHSKKSREDFLEEHLQDATSQLSLQLDELHELQAEHAELMALFDRPESETVKALLDALGSRYETVRRYAAFRLASISKQQGGGAVLDEEKAFMALGKALDDENILVRRNVMQFIGQAEGQYRDRLVRKALQQEDPQLLVMAAESVSGAAGTEAASRLEELLRDSPHTEVRVAVANVLGKVGSEESIPALMGALDDPAENVRWFAVEGLRKLDAGRAVPRISEVLNKDESARVRAIAATTLGELGQVAGGPALCQALDDPVERVREKAISALLQLAQDSYERMMPIADAFGKHGLPKESGEVLSRIISSFGDDEKMKDQVAEARRKLAQIMTQQGDFAGAAKTYEQLLASGEATIELQRKLIDSWLKANQPGQAVSALEGWLSAEKDKELPELAVNLADQFIRQGSFEAAATVLEMLEKQVQIGPENPLRPRIEGLRQQIATH
ncbi:MAG: HEAT repeat domain-containing protein [Planctomycetes bacterium]|nr:HEAT repeat domain-containing protein [Planctomycetota bacterium]